MAIFAKVMETSLTVENDSLRKHIKGAIASQKRPTITVLSSLLAIQDSVGYIPNEAIEEVAIAMKTTINTVFGVASFYPNFRFSPPGDHSVEVCWGPTCHLLGAGKVLDEVLEQLGLEDEGDTPDGKVSFRFNTCLGACSRGPVISIDHELYGNVTEAQASSLLKQFKDNPKTP
ncbi:MAG TPA: hypothetical protein EYP00_02730 [Dehalococcoidia bacterium]|nr:hypothetical protein [Dehalococcoidia bacterium]